MKIMIFEYITGGGFNKQQLPESLCQEGRLMLQALLANFFVLTDIDLVIMLDQRLLGTIDTQQHRVVTIDATQHTHDEFAQLAEQCDAVWPIAPEFDGILQRLCALVEATGKHLLTSPSVAVNLTANKYITYKHLQQHNITTVPTMLVSDIVTETFPQSIASTDEWIVKSIDGAGCIDSWLLTDMLELIALNTKERYIIQPHLHGQKTSLSCLFKEGFAWLVCVNVQHFNIINKCYQLSTITVNYTSDTNRYQPLIDSIALACPELWGYVGIDLIETTEHTWVLEINPRLTTAFVGIESALGINIAASVLQLLDNTPSIKPLYNKPITVTTNQGNHGH